MSAEDNKKIVLEWFENECAGKMDEFFDALADNMTWWVQGNTPISGTRTKPEMVALLGQTAAMIDGDIRLTPTGITAEGDRVAVEIESYAKLKNGKILEGTYHFLFIVREGKIETVKEYLDTLHMHELLAG